jgi:hypothetical protein
MSSFSRRKLLALCGSGIAGLSGCTQEDQLSESPEEQEGSMDRKFNSVQLELESPLDFTVDFIDGLLQPTESQPFGVSITVENNTETYYILSDSRDVFFELVSDNTQQFVLVPDHKFDSYPIQFDTCWETTQKIVTTKDLQTVEVPPGESIRRNLFLVQDTPTTDVCTSIPSELLFEIEFFIHTQPKLSNGQIVNSRLQIL